jgi:apolipoprotein D and lipocalin family protein
LSRKPVIDEEDYNLLLEKAKENGYDVSKLKRTQQSESIPEADEAANDKGIWWIKSLFGK